MEDPWSTPWAVDTPSASPGLTPTKPKNGATAATTTTTATLQMPGTGTITPTENGLSIGGGGGLGISGFEHSPWGSAATTTAATTNGFDATTPISGFDVRHDPPQQQSGTHTEDDEDAWGGWDDGKHGGGGGNSNAWASSHGGDVVREPAASSNEFAAPWGEFVEDKQGHREGFADSAVSFGDQQAVKEDLRVVPVVKVEDETKKNAITLLEDEQDAWSAPKEEAVAPSVAIAAAKAPASETAEDVKTRVDDKTELDVAEPAQAKATMDVEQPAAEEHKSTSQVEQQDQQQTASKVQELVDMYDGIANKAARPPPNTIAREAKPKGSAETSREDESMVESEIVEVPASDDAVQPSDDTNYSTATVEMNSPVQDTEGSELAPESDAVEDEAKIHSAETAEEPKINDIPTPPSIDEEQPPPKGTKSDIKPLPYPIDLSNLDALFPGSKPSTTNPEPVPDVIIDNSYTTTSERKTWYRISRFGSMRKHDSGDEDNYKRITWANSEVHDKTLHIVRRWMEQDSIAGRVVLGSRKAGPLGASMFNWDSSEPQIEISELLRQRVQKGNSGGGHARNRSLPQADAPPQTPTMESFGGWGANASMPSTPSAVVQSPSFAAHIKAKTGSALRPPDSPAEMPKSPWDDEEGRDEERKKSTELMPPPPAPAAPDAAPETKSEPIEADSSTTEEDDDDDDDWGEMVSSPTVDSSSTFASLSAPADTKPTQLTQSFEADFSGLDFFEESSSVTAAKPAAAAMVRPNPPPAIQTAGIVSQSKPAVPSPIWTPTMNSPALEPMRVSMDDMRKSQTGTPTLASTPVLEAPRASTSSNRLSTENAWAPVLPNPTGNSESMNDLWNSSVPQPTANNRSSMEKTQTPMAAFPTTPAAPALKQPASKRVSFEGTRTADDKVAIEGALCSLPDLSYMLR